MHLTQTLAVALVALICSVSCLPAPSLQPPREGRARARKTNLESRTPYPHHGIIWKKLLPFMQTAFTNAVTATIVNWFYPWRIVPYPPGKIGIAQLWGGYGHGHHHQYGRRRRSSLDHPSETPREPTS